LDEGQCPRSSSGLKCGSFRSGDSIWRPDRSKAEKRMGVDGDSPSPELGLELVPFEVAWLKPGLGLASKLGLAGSRAEQAVERVMTFSVSSMRIR
jgi:hypothetical protein